MSWISYLILGVLIISGIQLLRSGLRKKNPKERLKIFSIKQSQYVTQKDKSIRITYGIMLLIISLIIIWNLV